MSGSRKVSGQCGLLQSLYTNAVLRCNSVSNATCLCLPPSTFKLMARACPVIEEMLRPLINRRRDDWDQHLTAMEYAYNDFVQASTDHTSFILTAANTLGPQWTSSTPTLSRLAWYAFHSGQLGPSLARMVLASDRVTGKRSPG